MNLLAALILGALVLVQSTNLSAEDASPLTRIQQIQRERSKNLPSTAEYQLNGIRQPTFTGRAAKCRCYLTENREYFVEETADEWTSQIWFRNKTLIWRYSEPEIDEAFAFAINDHADAEGLLKAKGFGTCRMDAFDQSAVAQSKTKSLAVSDCGFALVDVATKKNTIEYCWKKGLPEWKQETDKILSRIEGGEINLRRVGLEATYSDCLDMIGQERTKESVLDKEALAIVAKENGHLIPSGRGISVEKAVSTQRGQLLTMDVKVDDTSFQVVQYQLGLELDRKGDIIDPVPAKMLLRRRKFRHGVLCLISNGGPRNTLFFGKSGSTISYVGDVFENKEFIRLIQGLE